MKNIHVTSTSMVSVLVQVLFLASGSQHDEPDDLNRLGFGMGFGWGLYKLTWGKPAEALPLDALYFLAPSMENMDRLVEAKKSRMMMMDSTHQSGGRDPNVPTKEVQLASRFVICISMYIYNVCINVILFC